MSISGDSFDKGVECGFAGQSTSETPCLTSNEKGDVPMRCMIIVKATKDPEAGALPDEKLLSERGKFNEDLAKAGVLLAGEGLHPSSRGRA